MRSVDREGAILEEGHGTAVNDSATGMRLLLGIAPPKGSFWKFKLAIRPSGVRSVSSRSVGRNRCDKMRKERFTSSAVA